MRTLAQRLHKRALAGDMAAAGLLLRYTLGSPAPVVDPDRLDLEAFRLVQQFPDMLETFALAQRIHPGAAIEHVEKCKPWPYKAEEEAHA
jgi:hypothetical protein